MKSYLLPIGVFAMSMLAVLCFTLFFPAIDNASGNLTADTAGLAIVSSGAAWGFSWVSSSGTIKLIIFFGGVILAAILALKEFVKSR